jgi:hypothetical protein
MSEQRRRHQRVPSAIPFTLDDGSEAVSRDLSPSGVYFETEGKLAVGSVVRLALEVDNPSGDLLFQCVARVVRIRTENGKTGVGAEIVESHLERKDTSTQSAAIARADAIARIRALSGS